MHETYCPTSHRDREVQVVQMISRITRIPLLCVIVWKYIL